MQYGHIDLEKISNNTVQKSTGYLDPDEIKKALEKYGISYDSMHEKQQRDHEFRRYQLHL